MTATNIHSSAREIAEEYANKIWNQKEIGAIDRLVHKDVLIHSLLGDFRGTQAMKEVVQAWLKGFPDLSVKTAQRFLRRVKHENWSDLRYS